MNFFIRIVMVACVLVMSDFIFASDAIKCHRSQINRVSGFECTVLVDNFIIEKITANDGRCTVDVRSMDRWLTNTCNAIGCTSQVRDAMQFELVRLKAFRFNVAYAYADVFAGTPPDIASFSNECGGKNILNAVIVTNKGSYKIDF